jgi:hypothetical protein
LSPGQVARVPADAEVDGPFADAADDLGADALFEAHAHRLMAGKEAADVIRQEFRQHRQAREHANAALRAACELGQFATHLFEHVQHVARLPQQYFAGRRRHDAATAALQQRYADVRLDPGDALADRRGHDRFAVGGTRDIPLLAYGNEQAQRDRVEIALHLRILPCRTGTMMLPK